MIWISCLLNIRVTQKKDTFSIDLMNIEIVNSQSLSSSFPSMRQEKWEQLSLCVSIERLLINCSSANSDISNILTLYDREDDTNKIVTAQLS